MYQRRHGENGADAMAAAAAARIGERHRAGGTMCNKLAAGASASNSAAMAAAGGCVAKRRKAWHVIMKETLKK